MLRSTNEGPLGPGSIARVHRPSHSEASLFVSVVPVLMLLALRVSAFHQFMGFGHGPGG